MLYALVIINYLCISSCSAQYWMGITHGKLKMMLLIKLILREYYNLSNWSFRIAKKKNWLLFQCIKEKFNFYVKTYSFCSDKLKLYELWVVVYDFNYNTILLLRISWITNIQLFVFISILFYLMLASSIVQRFWCEWNVQSKSIMFHLYHIFDVISRELFFFIVMFCLFALFSYLV